MNIREFAFNLQKVYAEMAETFSTYQASTGLTCLNSCGRCCLNPEIEASILEMIPLALKIHDEGHVDLWLQKLENNNQSHCVLFVSGKEPGQGYCSSYQERPSVCRMFGVAGTFDKHQKSKLSVCKYIKEVNSTVVMPDESTPLIPQWSAKLSSLDPDLVKKKIPINEAITGALEKIALYAQYQDL